MGLLVVPTSKSKGSSGHRGLLSLLQGRGEERRAERPRERLARLFSSSYGQKYNNTSSAIADLQTVLTCSLSWDRGRSDSAVVAVSITC